MTIAKVHAEWLDLVEINGPFLTLPVLTEHFRSGLEPTDADLVAELHTAQREVEDDPTLHRMWTQWVVSRLLGFPDDVLREGAALGPSLTHRVVEHGETLRPNLAVVDQADDGSDRARLLVAVWPAGTDLTERPEGERWAASPIDRMAELCRATTVRLGLVTNGDAWTLVDAPTDGATGTATWDATLWTEERATLDAFTTLLGVRRFFTVPDNETLEALLAQSANAEAEVTDQLGRQVRAAVELLVDAMSRADRDRGGSVFRELAEAEIEQDLEPYIYESAVTVLMRLVFLLSAEERGLFLLGDPTYDATYAVSTLLSQLDEDANRFGEDVLERRTDAWHRLLATFRMVHAGAAHANLRLPPYGGSLFDPDRFPFLEGRRPGQPRDEHGAPLRIDNRTIKHILDALQVLRFRGKGGWQEARRLSFRTLGVEQIGHVYEGLLDHGVVQVTSEAVALTGKNDPEVALELIEEVARKGHGALVSCLAELTGDSVKSIEKALTSDPDPDHLDRLTSACDNDPELAARITPYLGLLRTDLRGLPQVYLPDSYYVTKSSDRRSSGAYYTPRSLAEEMVAHTLEPLVFHPGRAEGEDPSAWKRRSSVELLELRVCDMAMGSGAFLVSACRYLSERLLEAWDAEGVAPGDSIPLPNGVMASMPDDETDQEVLARRLVADRCLYGVDRNPMAVEMAKLSLWLITLAKDRPFTFVDHALRCGDSLLGVIDLGQLESFHLDPARGRALHGGTLFDPATCIEPLVKTALAKRRELESFPVVDVHDAERKQRLLDESNALLDQLRVPANLVIGAALATDQKLKPETYDLQLAAIARDVVAALEADQGGLARRGRLEDLNRQAMYWLDEGRPAFAPARKCLHWVLEFPEVFLDGSAPGFDAVVGNPPFLGGVALAKTFGTPYERLLKGQVPESSGFVDLAVYFHRRAATVARPDGAIGLLGPQNLVNTVNRVAGTDVLLKSGRVIAAAWKKRRWPGTASLFVCAIVYASSDFRGRRMLDGQVVLDISGSLDAEIDLTSVSRLRPWLTYTQGTDLYGASFIKSEAEWGSFVSREPALEAYLRPYVNAQILCASPHFRSDLLVVDFGDLDKRDLHDVAETVAHLEREVGHERSKQTRQVHESRPWLHWDKRLRSYEVARTSTTVMVCPSVSKHLPMLMVDSSYLFSKTTKFFPGARFRHYAVLQSAPFLLWAFATSRLRGDGIEFSTRSSLDTFPPPMLDGATRFDALGKQMWDLRTRAMNERGVGITDLLNMVHDPEEKEAPDVRELRDLQRTVDIAVADAYGWADVSLEHGFYETKQGTRFTIEPMARIHVLDRLLRLNRQYHLEETAAPPRRSTKSTKNTRRGHGNTTDQLF